MCLKRQPAPSGAHDGEDDDGEVAAEHQELSGGGGPKHEPWGAVVAAHGRRRPMEFPLSLQAGGPKESMRRSRLMSLVEAITNVAVGFLVAAATQIVVFPMSGFRCRLVRAFRWRWPSRRCRSAVAFS
jgi:hypothetical protein